MEGKEEDPTEKTYVNKRKNLDSSIYNEFGDLMCDRVHTDLGSMSASMMKVGEELKLTLDKCSYFVIVDMYIFIVIVFL